MRVLKQNKRILLIIVSVIFLIGGCCLIYVKIIDRNNNYYNELSYDNLLIDNVNNDEKNNEKNYSNKSENAGSNGTSSDNANIHEIYIHISGEVKNGGVIKLKEGQIIIDAIEMAGGVTEFADLESVNLAFVLSDGQKVNIPNIENKNENISYVSNNSGYNIIVDNGNKANDGGDKVNINSATQTELETLEGIGPSTAAKIIEYREKNGGFNKIEDIKNISGIGNAKFEKIKDNVVVK